MNSFHLLSLGNVKFKNAFICIGFDVWSFALHFCIFRKNCMKWKNMKEFRPNDVLCKFTISIHRILFVFWLVCFAHGIKMAQNSRSKTVVSLASTIVKYQRPQFSIPFRWTYWEIHFHFLWMPDSVQMCWVFIVVIYVSHAPCILLQSASQYGMFYLRCGKEYTQGKSSDRMTESVCVRRVQWFYFRFSKTSTFKCFATKILVAQIQ